MPDLLLVKGAVFTLEVFALFLLCLAIIWIAGQLEGRE